MKVTGEKLSSGKIKKLPKIRYLRSKLRSISANFFASRNRQFLIRIFDDAASCRALNPKILMNRRGLSAVIVTVMLILLTISAAAIISSFVIPFVRNNLNSGTECFDYREHFTFEEDFGYNCFYNISTQQYYAISIRAGSLPAGKENNVNGIGLYFLGDGDSVSVNIIDGADITAQTRMLDGTETVFRIPQTGEVRTYIYQNNAAFSTAVVAPKLVSGRTCDQTDSIALQECENVPA